MDDGSTKNPSTSDEFWTTSNVARWLGVTVSTVSSYRRRHQMPEPDKVIGRTVLWKPATIVTWHENRPRVGNTATQRNEGDSAPQLHVKTFDDPESKWKVHGTRNVYDSPWVRMNMVDVELPDGERFEHHTLELPSAAMVAILNDEGTQVLLMWRHRFVPNVWNWELAGGVVDDNEDPAETAKRELAEEMGLEPKHLERIAEFEPMIGMVQSPHTVFLARGVNKIGEPTERNEMAHMEWVSISDIPRLIREGTVRNSGALVALLYILSMSPDSRRS